MRILTQGLQRWRVLAVHQGHFNTRQSGGFDAHALGNFGLGKAGGFPSFQQYIKRGKFICSSAYASANSASLRLRPEELAHTNWF